VLEGKRWQRRHSVLPRVDESKVECPITAFHENQGAAFVAVVPGIVGVRVQFVARYRRVTSVCRPALACRCFRLRCQRGKLHKKAGHCTELQFNWRSTKFGDSCSGRGLGAVGKMRAPFPASRVNHGNRGDFPKYPTSRWAFAPSPDATLNAVIGSQDTLIFKTQREFFGLADPLSEVPFFVRYSPPPATHVQKLRHSLLGYPALAP